MKIRSVFCAIVAASAFCLSTSHATILIFDVGLTGQDTSVMLTSGSFAAYGDNVSSTNQTISGNTVSYLEGNGFTPNIVTDYSFGGDKAVAINAYHNDPPNGFGTNVAYLAADQVVPPDHIANFYFTFTPDSGYKPIINSFQLGTYGPANIEITWRLRPDSITGTVFDSGSLSLSGNFFSNSTQQTITTSGLSYAGITVLEVTQTDGPGGTLALDNLNFDQAVVPEPGTVALLAVSGLAMVFLLRKRRATV